MRGFETAARKTATSQMTSANPTNQLTFDRTASALAPTHLRAMEPNMTATLRDIKKMRVMPHDAQNLKTVLLTQSQSQALFARAANGGVSPRSQERKSQGRSGCVITTKQGLLNSQQNFYVPPSKPEQKDYLLSQYANSHFKGVKIPSKVPFSRGGFQYVLPSDLAK